MSGTPLIRGSTKELLEYLGSSLPKGKRAGLKPLADFAGVAVRSAYRWIHGRTAPLGSDLVKARSFFEHNGYQVVELEQLSPSIRDFTRLIGYGIITVHTAASRVELASGHLLQILIGRVGTSPDVEERMRDLYAEYKPALEAKMNSLPRQSSRNGSWSGSAVPAVITPARLIVLSDSQQAEEREEPRDEDERAKIHALTIKALAALIQSAIPLAKDMLSDKYTPEERRALRKNADVFALSNNLNQLTTLMHGLCGETARGLKLTRWNKATTTSQKQHD